MKELINVIGINEVNYLSKYVSGKFRFVSKSRAGFMICNDAQDFENAKYMKNPGHLLGAFQRGTLQSIQFKPEGSDFWLTVFARTGKKINFIDTAILTNLTVGTINQYFDNTDLMNHFQYDAVNAKSWASRAFVMNTPVEEVAC
jgi:hypothetical protein